MNKWYQTPDTYIFLFNVGRGLSIFIRTPNNYGIIYDLGSSDDFSPIDFIKKNIGPNLQKYNSNGNLKKFAQLIISHPHEDHISEISKIHDDDIGLLTCPHNKNDSGYEEEKFDFSCVEEGEKIEIYKNLFLTRKLPLQTIQYSIETTQTPISEYGLYYLKPKYVKNIHPNNNHLYTNGCSIMLYYKHGENSILIPGDITPEVFNSIMNKESGSEKRYTEFNLESKYKNWHLKTSDQPDLKDNLKRFGLSVLIAPHHGLESCYTQILFDNIKFNKPKIIGISEKRHVSENDGNIHNNYQSKDFSKGHYVNFKGELKENYSITTRNRDHYLIKFKSDNKMDIFAEKEPLRLLDY
jgi:hypothetical protein